MTRFLIFCLLLYGGAMAAQSVAVNNDPAPAPATYSGGAPAAKSLPQYTQTQDSLTVGCRATRGRLQMVEGGCAYTIWIDPRTQTAFVAAKVRRGWKRFNLDEKFVSRYAD